MTSGRVAEAPVLAWTATAADARVTTDLGRILGQEAPDGAVLLLEGALGAGKTTFAQGVALGCGVDEPVTSPTYNLVLHYRGRRAFTHVDLYRLANASGLATLDLDEIVVGAGVTCVEWPDLIRSVVEPPFAEIALQRVPQAGASRRRLAGRLVGRHWESVRASLERAGVAFEE